jgi:predicted dienelactone hydrolase
MFSLFRKLLFKLGKNSLLVSVSSKTKLGKFSKNPVLAIATLMLVLMLQFPTYSAERIKFNYGLLGFKVEVADLKLFAEEGIVTDRLDFYLKRIAPEKRAKFQDFLQQSYDVNPVLVYRFSRTSVGIRMLKRLGEMIQIPQKINGLYALRAGLLKDAASDSEISFMEFLKYFPTDVQLNLSEILKQVKQISQTEQDAQDFITTLKQQKASLEQQAITKIFPDLSVLGNFKPKQETIKFYDKKRDRTIVTDLYLPEQLVNNTPIIVVSNGLGAERKRFAELANHLTSYGFAVAVPEHPGSNYQRQRDFIKGLYQENFDATDYFNRPWDISFILDKLTEINHNQLDNKLDVENVGIFGYSIGGTTALSLAGAEIDFPHLQEACQENLDLTNISILYQCRALEMKSRKVSFKDERIKAAFLFVPFGKSLFSETELEKVTIPMLWQVVDKDFLTSLTKEQLPVFKALKKSDRFLLLSEKLPHSTAILSKQRSASQQNESRIARKYQNILSLVFFKKYLTEDKEYSSYLNNDFVKEITEAPYTLHLTKEVPKINERSNY